MAQNVNLGGSFKIDGREYVIFFDQTSHAEAIDKCIFLGKTLATVSDFAEFQELKTVLMEMYIRDFEGTAPFPYPDRIFLGNPFTQELPQLLRSELISSLAQVTSGTRLIG